MGNTSNRPYVETKTSRLSFPITIRALILMPYAAYLRSQLGMSHSDNFYGGVIRTLKTLSNKKLLSERVNARY